MAVHRPCEHTHSDKHQVHYNWWAWVSWALLPAVLQSQYYYLCWGASHRGQAHGLRGDHTYPSKILISSTWLRCSRLNIFSVMLFPTCVFLIWVPWDIIERPTSDCKISYNLLKAVNVDIMANMNENHAFTSKALLSLSSNTIFCVFWGFFKLNICIKRNWVVGKYNTNCICIENLCFLLYYNAFSITWDALIFFNSVIIEAWFLLTLNGCWACVLS